MKTTRPNLARIKKLTAERKKKKLERQNEAIKRIATKKGSTLASKALLAKTRGKGKVGSGAIKRAVEGSALRRTKRNLKSLINQY